MFDQEKYIIAIRKMIDDATDPDRKNNACFLLKCIIGQTIHNKFAVDKAIHLAKKLLHGAKASRPMLMELIDDLKRFNLIDKDVQPELDLSTPTKTPFQEMLDKATAETNQIMKNVGNAINYPQNLRPTTVFLGVDPNQQFRHMVEELGEIASAMRAGDMDHAAEEAADLQQSAETFIANLGKNGNEIRKAVIEKNEARGYYEKSQSELLGGCFISNSIVRGVGVGQPVVVNEHGGKQSDSHYCFNDLDPRAMLMIAERSGYGRKKYGPKNWTKIPVDEHLNHAMAHIYAYMAGDRSDTIAGGHLSGAGWRIIAALGQALRGR